MKARVNNALAKLDESTLIGTYYGYSCSHILFPQTCDVAVIE